MPRPLLALAVAALVSTADAQTTSPAVTPTPAQLYDLARASLVVVRYTWASELGPHAVDTPGVVVDASGLILCSGATVSDSVPLAQIQDVKIVIPRVGDEAIELPAEFEGRDDRCGMAFFKAVAPRTWQPLAFVSDTVAAPGDSVVTVGLLGQSNGYKAAIGRSMVASVAAEGPAVTLDGRTPGAGAIIFDASGRPIGYSVATPQPGGGRGGAGATGPSTFMPAVAFAKEITDPPTPQRPVVVPWLGIADWHGLRQDEAAYYGVKTPALSIGGIVPGGALERAGINAGTIVVGLDGQPLTRGEDAESIPTLFRQRIIKLKPGTLVRFDVVDARESPPRRVDVTLDAAPAAASTAARFWSESMGLGVRDAVVLDRFGRRLPADAPGVVTTLVRAGSQAEAAHVAPETFVRAVGGTPVANVTAFAEAIKAQRPGEPVILLVNQGGRDSILRVEPTQ